MLLNTNTGLSYMSRDIYEQFWRNSDEEIKAFKNK